MKPFHRHPSLGFFALLCAVACASISNAQEQGNLGEPIDRHALVTRHNPHITQILPMSPLHLGNGSMVFTADFTGLQTFPQHHVKGLPIQTVAGWGWNRFPNENRLPYASILKPGEYQVVSPCGQTRVVLPAFAIGVGRVVEAVVVCRPTGS